MGKVSWINLNPVDILPGIPANDPFDIQKVLREARKQGLFFWVDRDRDTIVYANDWETIEKIEKIARKHELILKEVM